MLFRVALTGVIAWFLLLPLRDVLSFPERISVLPNLETDAAAYDAFAREFANTWSIDALPTKHPPGWMVILAVVYGTVGHSYVAGKLISWVALLATVVACAWIADRVFGRTAAIIAALLCASSPGLRAYVGTLQYEVLTGALFAIFIALTIRMSQRETPRAAVTVAVMAGVIGAALVLTRETFVLVVPIAAAWAAVTRLRQSRAAAWLAPIVLVAVAAVPALAWSAVQTYRLQRPVVISDKAREVFDAGNNPLANGTYNEPLVGIGEPAGFAFIRAYPLETVRLAGRKLLYSFGVLRDGWNVPHPASVWLWRATTGALPLAVIDPVVRGGWLLVMVVAGLALLGRAGLARWWLLPATCAAILTVHIVTLASYRFTVPLLPILYVLASGPLAWIVRRVIPTVQARVVAIPVAVMLMIAVAAQFQTWPLHASYQAADLEGLAASNEHDSLAGDTVRFADAKRGMRPVAILPDTYLPSGSLRLTARMRKASATAAEMTPVARISLTQVSGRHACVADVPAGQLSADTFTDVAVLCHLDRDGPATLAVYTMGMDELAIDTIELQWR